MKDTHSSEELLKRIADLQTESDKLKQALKDENAPMLARVVHTIKGFSANIGVNTIREAALEMEIVSKELT